MTKNRWVRWSLRFGAAYGFTCLGIMLFQRSLLYFPTHHDHANGMSRWVYKGQTIGFCREVESPTSVWLMMHGNAGQASDRSYVLQHLSSNDAFYVLEYPVYGTRDGSPSQSSIDQAAADAYQSLRAKYPDAAIGVIGESIGSGPASALATQATPPDKIVLITPFDSLYRVAAKRFPWLPVWLLLLDRWNNVESLKSYSGSLEIFGATHDEIIPVEHARRLAQEVSHAKLTEVSTGHNDWTRSDAVKITPSPNE